MPKTDLVFYRETDGTIPLLEWFYELDTTIRAKCRAKLERLIMFGYQLRRPDCDYLRDGIYELRARQGTVNYRILYGFAGKNLVLLSHGCTKEKEVSPREIERAIRNMDRYKRNPKAHSGTDVVEI
jgi:putative component of toxin-antitoxin plasmid stabilization module